MCVLFDCAVQRCQVDAFAVCRAITLCGQDFGALVDFLLEYRGFGDIVDQSPVLRFLTTHTFGSGTENIRQVVTYMTFVGDSRQPASSRQHTEQWHLGQADRARTVVNQDDFVTGQRELVTAAGTGAIDRGNEFEAAILRRVFESIAGFIGKFAEVDLP